MVRRSRSTVTTVAERLYVSNRADGITFAEAIADGDRRLSSSVSFMR